MKNKDLNKNIATDYLSLIRAVNDAYVFLHQAAPILKEARNDFDRSVTSDKRKFIIPSFKPSSIIHRTDQELKEIFDRYMDRGLFENALVTVVSKTEDFLQKVLAHLFKKNPGQLATNVEKGQSKEESRKIDIEIVIRSETIEEIQDHLIKKRLHEVFHASPKEYLKYFSKITGLETQNDFFFDYIELKAGRDLLVHNEGLINELYISKTGAKARGKKGELSPLIRTDYAAHLASYSAGQQ